VRELATGAFVLRQVNSAGMIVSSEEVVSRGQGNRDAGAGGL
jgi:hypothetical protein